jgi:hypothetical protein
MASIAVAIDMGAGEKERGTLVVAAAADFAHHAGGGQVPGNPVRCRGVGRHRPDVDGLCAMQLLGEAGASCNRSRSMCMLPSCWMLGLLIPPAHAMVSALLLAISSSRAATRRPPCAANHDQIFMPIMASMLPGMKLGDGWSLVPIVNTALAIKEVVKGTITALDHASVLASTSLIAGLLLALCVYWQARSGAVPFLAARLSASSAGSPGGRRVTPRRSRKAVAKLPALLKPISRAMSCTSISVSFNNSSPRRMRSSRMKPNTVMPVCSRNTCDSFSR